MELRGADRLSFPMVGFGLPLIATLLWLMQRRHPEQETLAGAARLATASP